MKYNILKIIIIILFLIISQNCLNKTKNINVLTDDINLLKMADMFNYYHNNIKVSIDYLNIINYKKENIFNYIKINKKHSYDLVIGYYYPKFDIDPNYYYKMTKYIKNFENDNNFYPIFYDFYKKNNEYCCLYGMDIPVIIINNKIIKEKYANSVFDFKNFIKIAQSVNYLNNNGKNETIKIGFSPLASNTDKINYFFIFNSCIVKNGKKYLFNADNAFNFYTKFDDNYNYGIKVTNKYLEKFNFIKKNQFLKKDIISLDFMSLSKALTYPSDKYSLFLIKDLNYSSLKIKSFSIIKKSKNKKNIMQFINFLLDKKNQSILFNETLNSQYQINNCHIPINKDIINKIENLNIKNDTLMEYLSKIKYPDFYNKKMQEVFFTKYNYCENLLNKGILKENNYIDFLSEQLNK